MKNILKNISIVVLFLFLAKFFSFIIELLIASKFGVTNETDVYYMVTGIIQVIYPMISIGIWKVFLPEYKEKISLGNKLAANILTNKLICVFIVISITVMAIIILFPHFIIKIFAPGFNETAILLAVPLIRILSFMFIFNVLATFFSGILQSNNQFAKSQFKEVIQHLPPILYLLFSFGFAGLNGLTYVIVFGSFLSFFIEYIFVKKYYSFKMPKKMLDTNILSVLKRVPITCLNSIINQLNSIIDKAFASSLTIGAVTCLNYGGKLVNLFDGLFSTAISTALFPKIAELAVSKDKNKLKKFIKNYLIFVISVITPLTAIILIFSKEIVIIVFGRGKFDIDAINTTSMVLLTYSIGLVAMSVTTIINDLFFILKKTNTLLFTTIINIASNIILDILFLQKHGVFALSLATTISLYLSLGIKLYLLKNWIFFDKKLFNIFIFVFSSCLISAIPVCFFKTLNIDVLLLLIMGVLLFVTCYCVILFGLNTYYRKKLFLLIYGTKERK